MGLGYDCASLLLCAEDISTTILDFDDDAIGGAGDGYEDGWSKPIGLLAQSCDLFGGGDELKLPPPQSDEFLADLLERESQHLPRGDYLERLLTGALDPSIRGDAIDWIAKVHAYYSFGPLSAYLSINYLNRFLSSYELPRGKAWMTQLLSVACLSLAAKMDETLVPLSLDLQVGEARYVFEARTIQRMEALVMSTLKWRMHAVTPFSFIDYFLRKLNGSTSVSKYSVARSVKLIMSTTRDIDFLEFMPSEIAMAAALLTLGESQIAEIDIVLACASLINKDKVSRCYDAILRTTAVMNATFKNGIPSASSMPQSPVGVLEASACMSYSSCDMESLSTSFCTPPPRKKMKLDLL